MRKTSLILTKDLPIELVSYLMLGDAVIITDSNHMIVDVNNHYETTTGYSRDFIIGKKAEFLRLG
ncbi:PAS domain S-box protein [Bacillus sp. FJAT-29937]|uniref:PAS domain S-box protein n=1 Tax=Bacillus sp. FJAT-29937 TaxID=1720553 RepID=UPI001E641BEE|nr:PAS domain-containing protein [Bacillus sp. FJAT-29937]